jgi:hypothetical protein
MADANDAELVQLHERLLAGDPVAPGVLTERLLSLLKDRLRGLARSLDYPHVLPSAMGLVLAEYLRDPSRYDPTRGGLVSFLAMQIRGDVLNELDARRRRRQRESPVATPVELAAAARNPTVEEEALNASIRSTFRHQPSRLPGGLLASSMRSIGGCSRWWPMACVPPAHTRPCWRSHTYRKTPAEARQASQGPPTEAIGTTPWPTLLTKRS